MKMIDNKIENLREEVDGACSYAEEYIKLKAKGDTNRANKYRELANDELRHAETLHAFAVQDIEEIKKVFPLPIEEEEKWEHAHKHCTERMALIRQMISM